MNFGKISTDDEATEYATELMRKYDKDLDGYLELLEWENMFLDEIIIAKALF